MKKHTRILLLGVSAMFALGTLTACSGGTSNEASTSEPDATTTTAVAPATAAPFPEKARYIADMEKDGKTMTIGIAVEGSEIAAYACNGTDDEAWFFGNQDDGAIDVTSRFRDTLKASFDGTDVAGDLTMDGVTYTFTAAPVADPAGMYTAEVDGVRASWVLRPDGSALGVQLNGTSGRDFEQAELQILKNDQFRAEVRNKRILQQANQLSRLNDGSFGSSINGKPVKATLVNGTFRFTH
ncbi:MAG: hypothetical protein JST91_15010 [Actinobacteria bacterium]|nr:hypothetical protein [Actinomycetota bacterium]